MERFEIPDAVADGETRPLLKVLMPSKTVRVLVADDSEDDRLLLSRHLRMLPGFELCGTTVNGVETIAWLNASPPYSNRQKYPFPDLLLLDYQMPGFSGIEVLEWLHSQWRQPAVILWSDAVDQIDEPTAFQLGATMVCAKPCGRAELTALLAQLFPALLPPAPVSNPRSPQRRKSLL